MKAAPDSPLYKSYRNTLYCKESIIVDPEGHTHSKFCKNRWCPTCNSIRTAVLIESYKDSLAALKDMQFVTLTLPTCPADELPWQIERMQKAWSKIIQSRTWRRLHPSGMKKEECTLRPDDLYHFHYHIVVDGKEKAKFIVSEWLRHFPEADVKAQNIQRVKNPEKFPLELFKYFTKLFTADKTHGTRSLDFKRLDVVMVAMRGRRTFQPFGNLIKVEINEDEAFELLESQNEKPGEVWLWKWHDWVEISTGEMYSNWKPSGKLSQVFNEYINEEIDPPPI